MIKIKNVNKYFNLRKSNEIHVINNTTLDFSETGLVCLLGPSGSGKTTLLNIVGGLDNINNGEIQFKDYILKKYDASKWDYIRSRHFGYIFQNYILLPELTVYQNLELVLKILNLDNEEIERRIDYALNAVGMLKFKKRKPTQLSGGQQQRVAIARALVKSPDVVIADEPTGNLDEKNTTQIMSIIKKISKECLVILVTHERRLAEFYGDRIIELSDGKVVNDIIVSATDEFKEVDNRNIYLQEYSKEEANSEDLNVKYFYKDNKEKLDLNIIFQDNTFYIHTPNENVKIKFLDKSNEIKVIDSKKPVISRKQIEEFDYHIPKIEENNTKKDSVIKFKDTLKMAFRQLSSLKKIQKLLLLIMFLSPIMITIGFINLFTASTIHEDDFLYFNRNIVTSDLKYNDIKNNLTSDEIVLFNPDRAIISYLNNGYFEHSKDNLSLYNMEQRNGYTNSIIPVESIKEPKLVTGKLPSGYGEAVIDKYLVDKYIKYPNLNNAGIKYIEQFIGLTFSINQYINDGFGDEFKIVGIVDNGNPNIYIRETDYKSVYASRYANFIDISIYDIDNIGNPKYRKVKSDGTLVSDELVDIPELVGNQAIVDPFFYENYVKNSGSNLVDYSNGFKIEVIGYTSTKIYASFGHVFVNKNSLNDLYISKIKDFDNEKTYIYSNNPEVFINKFSDPDKLDLMYNYVYEQIKFYAFNLDLFISSLVILGASLVFLYFLMRSSLMSRVYQVGVYRALGIKKSNVYRIFFTEILILTIITAIPGILGVGFVVNKINEIMKLIYYPWFIAPISLLFVFVVNAVVGLLPVNNLLRHTPSQILSKYDI